MGRTINPDDLGPTSHKTHNDSKRGGRRFQSSQPRQVLISKALSRLLRHQAENVGVPITPDGWVRLDHILAWSGLSGRGGLPGGPVGIEEVWSVVEENEKKRFAVKLVRGGKEVDVEREELDGQPVATVAEILGESSTGAGVTGTDTGLSEDKSMPVEQAEKTTTSSTTEQTQSTTVESQDPTTTSDSETARAIAYFRATSPQPTPSEFMIRATQGHSIKTITSDTGLLTPITLSSPSTIPSTCVHGTFYGSWTAILASGGLKRMGRNHVHFAEGPTLAELGLDERGEKIGELDAMVGVGVGVGEKKEVISGMRRDAQLLVYVDVRGALEGEKDMEWWRSENGVILTEGVAGEDEQGGDPADDIQDVTVQDDDGDGDGDDVAADIPAPQDQTKEKHPRDRKRHQHGKGKRAQTAAQADKLVAMKYWTVVVDVKGGRGVIWRRGDGVVKELPEELTRMGTPKGRGRGRGGGRGGSRGRGK